MSKFNFLDRRKGVQKISEELKAQHPKKPDRWILRTAKSLHVQRTIQMELGTEDSKLRFPQGGRR